MTPRVLRSGLSDRIYVTTRYTVGPGGQVRSQTKHDVTADVAALLAEAWKRGWDDCNGAKIGTTVANPYVPLMGRHE